MVVIPPELGAIDLHLPTIGLGILHMGIAEEAICSVVMTTSQPHPEHIGVQISVATSSVSKGS
jgi:hypothetical protein